MTEEKKENLAHNNYPYGSEMPIGSRDRSLYEDKKESFLNGINASINYTNCSESDSELLCECGANERIALDCTMKPCKHHKYYNN